MFAALGLVLVLASKAPADAGTLRGRLADDRGVVWVTDGSKPAPIMTEMRNQKKMFVPDLLAIPAGSTVRFPNDDPFFHSIYSESEPDAFDIGFYLTGAGKDVTFPQPGVLDVHCHIHVFMHANIVVVDGPYAMAEDHEFAIERVQPGQHVVHVWTQATGLRTTSVTVPQNGDVILERF